jgi:hypothetical protein
MTWLLWEAASLTKGCGSTGPQARLFTHAIAYRPCVRRHARMSRPASFDLAPLAARQSHMKRIPGEQSSRGHPSRRPPSASPQDEGLFRGAILNPHGEEAPKAPSRTMRPGIIRTRKTIATALPRAARNRRWEICRMDCSCSIVASCRLRTKRSLCSDIGCCMSLHS